MVKCDGNNKQTCNKSQCHYSTVVVSRIGNCFSVVQKMCANKKMIRFFTHECQHCIAFTLNPLQPYPVKLDHAASTLGFKKSVAERTPNHYFYVEQKKYHAWYETSSLVFEKQTLCDWLLSM